MNRVMRGGIAAAFIVAALSVSIAAQQQPGDTPGERARRVAPVASTPATGTQSDVDENFELNIAERRINERDFFASTGIEAGEASARGLSLRVGVAVGASEIDVLLRNVQGRVRFRGSLEALRRVLDARRPAAVARPDVP
ncbi:MAG TPA: hypothetical protein VK388_06180 [Pyrinomonadaceae bacterium]|nr:hypothetical protein [Pyrinomonadaceae bacterium]